ncbi:Voldacs domain-containing protein [Kitasatospora sp. NPDC087315]|uniref:Voldacs domain-containing protein n=1 Tax=Kitasatospora sp. NPDC087315 TaxID=3364069 RepID=UPI003801D705
MTRYSIDPERHELIATWGTGEGGLATRIGVLPAGTGTSALLGLARALTQLSEAAWRTYTHPASAASSQEPNSEGWRRSEERKAFDEVPLAITRPNLPQDGMLDVSYSPLVESAHRAGRALHTLDDRELTDAVLAETATELAAVENAELGDLTGRARQAVLLSREGASPVQVAAADRLLEQNPFGPAALLTEIDPTAAAVAAAHWLAAAAEVTAEATGHSPTTLLLEADNSEALPHETPTLVLELLEAGVSPYDAVTGLVRHALHIADGLLPDPAGLREQLEDLDDDLAEHTGPDTDPEDTGLRLTPLDPRRPARDLLEDLLTGIHGCQLLHEEYDDPDDEDADADEAEDRNDEQAEQHQGHGRERFAHLVRETATRHRDRLT